MTIPYDAHLLGLFWSSLLQKSPQKNTQQAELGLVCSRRTIRAKAEAHLAKSRAAVIPFYTADVFLHHSTNNRGVGEWLCGLKHSTIIIINVAAGAGRIGKMVRWWG
jgi:hypothetical protein